ncbi:MAG: RNA 3'-phosphate cyclase [Candidatus Heimdallarchaeota archaeon]|nr:MAG: RNA 3'-phosphate cyclase [Candidatus Heimdallarchaeota archaeon]
MHVFDGSQGEGGGAILRLVTSLCLMTQETVKIINIRKNRPNPGLQTQHLMALRALNDFCGGELEGDSLGSETIRFTPATNWQSHLKINVSTAGSLGLILQSLQIAILGVRNQPLTVELQGGATFGKWAPSIPYVKHVTWEVFRRMNFELKIKIDRHGFFPKGGARVSVIMNSPPNLEGLDLTSFHQPKLVNILSYASKHLQRARVAERQSKTIFNALEKQNIVSKIINEYVEADNPGSGVLLFSRTKNNVIGGDFVGERRVTAEKVGQKVFERYINTINSQSTVDPFLADQILPIMATASSSSSFLTPYLSNHTKTNITLIGELLGVEISTEKMDNQFMISIDV